MDNNILSSLVGMLLTRAGINMQAQAQIGGQLIITKIVIGDGILVDGQAVEDLTGLINPMMNIGVQDIAVIGDGTSRVRALLLNDYITAGFPMREIGVFAKIGESGEEKLYSYINVGDKYTWIHMPEELKIEDIIEVFIVVGSAQNVTAIINDRVTLVTKVELNEHINNKANPHKVTREQIGAAPTNNPMLTGDITIQNIPGDTSTVYKNLKLDTSGLAAYCRSVILLHRIYTDTKLTRFNFCNGSFHMLRGGNIANRSDILHVNTNSSYTENKYNLWADLVNQYGKDNMPYLATCQYEAKYYVCLVLPYRADHYAKGIFFEGRIVTESGYEALKVISFYKTDTSTVLNQEIYDSLKKVEYTGEYLFNGTGYAPDGFGLGKEAALATGDWNDYTATGFYMGVNLTNAPTIVEGFSHWYYVCVTKHNTSYAYQQAHGFGSAPLKTYERWLYNGTWKPWKEIITADHFTQSFTANGWTKLPNGLIIQWGHIMYLGSSGMNGAIDNFPIAFPNTCLLVVGSDAGAGANAVGASPISEKQFRVFGRSLVNANYVDTAISWLAVGK